MGGASVKLNQTMAALALAISGFFSVGDASLSFDPLSSGGLTFALESGEKCAAALLGQTDRADYFDWVRNSYEQYGRERAYFYRRETRWRAAPFWERRLPKETTELLELK